MNTQLSKESFFILYNYKYTTELWCEWWSIIMIIEVAINELDLVGLLNPPKHCCLYCGQKSFTKSASRLIPRGAAERILNCWQWSTEMSKYRSYWYRNFSIIYWIETNNTEFKLIVSVLANFYIFSTCLANFYCIFRWHFFKVFKIWKKIKQKFYILIRKIHIFL